MSDNTALVPQVFEHEEFGNIRGFLSDDEPFFVGKDVATALGYSNSRDAIKKHVDNEDKGVAKCDTPSGIQTMTIINESGLYSLILSSKLESARRFKRWVTSEVLPSIRKTGGYGQPTSTEITPTLLRDMADKLEHYEIQLVAKDQQIAELKPKASYYDVVLNCKVPISVTTIAKDYGWSARRMNQELVKRGIQYNQGGHWFLYQEYAEYGYTCTKTHVYLKDDGTQGVNIHTYWTPKGRLFIYNLLKEDGILPLIELQMEEDTVLIELVNSEEDK